MKTYFKNENELCNSKPAEDEIKLVSFDSIHEWDVEREIFPTSFPHIFRVPCA